MPDFLGSFPYAEMRPIQRETLAALQESWDRYDVFVIQAPTAFGKSALARCIMNALRSVSAITPTNQLVHQFLAEFPDTPTLHRLDSYWCEKWDRPCPVTRADRSLLSFCRGCECSRSLATAKFRRGPGIYNYYTYLSHKLHREVLVVDEAHNLLSTIRDRLALRIWRHDYRYPSNMRTPEDVTAWVDSLPEKQRRHKKIVALRESARYQVPEYIYQLTTGRFNGKGTVRGEPEERECIELLPVDISTAVPMFWPRDVQKLVLLSATIGPKDIEQLGLSRRRVCYIACESPIPVEQRPIILDSVNMFPVTRAMLEYDSSRVADYIQRVADYHSEEKGVVHVTYQLAQLLRPHLTGSRYLMHDRENKAEVYQRFRDSTRPVILLASGMYEGIDLPEDLGRWQIVAKVPWPSLASPAIRHLSELDPEWYIWETMRTVIQACGRISRTPEDYGVTYILDATVHRLLTGGGHLMPAWFDQAICCY